MNKPERWHTDLTAEQVRTLLHYDPDTGVFTWLVGRSDRVGKPARTSASHGYWTISYKGRNYRCARLAHLYMTGRWPAGEIDHIDGDGTNDRWNNLRVATRQQNEWNKVGRSNYSGFKGVTFLLNTALTHRWRAMIHINGVRVYLGCFATAEEAAAAYNTAAITHYGKFSPTRRRDFHKKTGEAGE